MTKHLRTVKSGIIVGLILISVIGATVPTTSAGILFNLSSVLNVSWGNETQAPIVPRGELRELTIKISHTVTRGALGRGLLQALQGSPVTITIAVVETPEWCTANIATGTLSVTVQPDIVQDVTTRLSMQVEEDAPAFGLGYVRIMAKAMKAGPIAAYEQEFTLSFIPDYKPLIKPSLPKANAIEIGPLDTATFPIDVENLGNARTVVLFNVVDVPENWNAVITSQVTLEEGKGSTGTAYLVIKPPKNFGYHFDEKTIRVSMQPVKADDYSKKGEKTYETFLVQSRGFSTPGFEGILLFGALLAVVLIMKRIRKT